MKSHVILITGLPASGKTTIGKDLAQRLDIPFISKDGIKESLFDTLGWKDRERSKNIGVASYSVLYYFVETLLKANASFILESNFKPEFDNPHWSALKNQYHFDVVQILCKTDGEVLFDRFKKRAGSAERHPGHVDATNDAEFKETLLKGHCEPLTMEGNVIEIDTTNWKKIDIDALAQRLKTGLN